MCLLSQVTKGAPTSFYCCDKAALQSLTDQIQPGKEFIETALQYKACLLSKVPACVPSFLEKVYFYPLPAWVTLGVRWGSRKEEVWIVEDPASGNSVREKQEAATALLLRQP